MSMEEEEGGVFSSEGLLERRVCVWWVWLVVDDTDGINLVVLVMVVVVVVGIVNDWEVGISLDDSNNNRRRRKKLVVDGAKTLY